MPTPDSSETGRAGAEPGKAVGTGAGAEAGAWAETGAAGGGKVAVGIMGLCCCCMVAARCAAMASAWGMSCSKMFENPGGICPNIICVPPVNMFGCGCVG